ncbi:hypothetical protein ILUMI_26884 [Ignelater luminosus]|uniref:DNA helicase MCM8 n=1 Tax=Ignelater luminosus TaxID=2038154 RepID=A0A8K0C7M3_IGNLU|nr:hypothetical protein ILUMI_26884 [Ignelater luminosus]
MSNNNPKFGNRKWFKNNRKRSSVGTQTSIKIEKNNNPLLHGYYGFKLYFFNNESIDITSTLNNIKAAEKYIKKNDKQFSLPSIKSNKMYVVDLNQIELDEDFQLDWSTFKSDIIIKTEYCLSCMGLAMHQIITLEEKKNFEDDIPFQIPYINARITNHQPVLNLKNLKVNCYGTLVAIRGTVIKASSVRLLCKYMVFKCSSCSGTAIVNQLDGSYSAPTKCPTKGCRAQSNFIPEFTTHTITVNWQTLKLQELVALDQGENGRIPRTIECELTEDLVGCCIPGDDITITGFFLLYIDAISVVNNKNQNEAISGTIERITFNTHDYYAIQKIHAEPSLFRFLVQSLCPNIFGNEIVKAGLLLTLFGGTQTNEGDITTRAVSHALMVGDPGLGKSQMLQACTNVAPRGVYVCGNTSTTSGLTVTMTKESSGEYSLEAGALILADQGCCCIDEFDKMTNQHAYLLEAMEQQSVSIAKAGVTCNLSACTSIIAAANPSGGHYNKAKTVSENIKMSPPLISRFDLIFILLDQPSEQYDVLLSEHVLALHSGLQTKSFSVSTNLCDDNKSKSLKDCLKLRPGESIDYLPHQLLRKYIAYAQKYVHPRVSQEAQDVLRQFYLELRKQCQVNSCSPVTARQLESLLRLTQARAKVELREEASVADAIDVVEIMRHSIIDIFTDEFGTFDFKRSQSGSGLSKQNQVKKLLLSLQQTAENLTQSVFPLKEIQSLAEQVGIGKDRFHDVLQTLNLHGYLLKRSSDKYQLTSVDFV